MFDFVYDIIADGDASSIGYIIGEMQYAIEVAENKLSEIEEEKNTRDIWSYYCDSGKCPKYAECKQNTNECIYDWYDEPSEEIRQVVNDFLKED